MGLLWMTEGWAGSSITPHQFHWWSTKHFLKTLRNSSMLSFGKIWACLYNHCLFTSYLHSLLFPLLHWNWFLEALKWSSFAQIQCIFINSISSWPVSSVQSLSDVRLFATPWTVTCQAPLSITNSQNLLKLIHWVGDAIQPSHPLSSPSPPALSQDQGLFQWVSLHQVAKGLELQLQPQSFQWILRIEIFFLHCFKTCWFISCPDFLILCFSSLSGSASCSSFLTGNADWNSSLNSLILRVSKHFLWWVDSFPKLHWWPFGDNPN